MKLNRREFLVASGALVAAGSAGAACHPVRRPSVVVRRPSRSFVPVDVARDRIIRTVVGLRPFRPSGFVVRAEKLDDRTLVHNYGHGGGGMTMSWGTSHLAVELAAEAGAHDCAVIGCGAVGLATARLLQRRGCAVTIYAKDLPPNTTSNISGAQWAPAEVYDQRSITPEFHDRFVRAAHLSHREYQNLVGDVYGVRWVENYVISAKPFSNGPQGSGQGIQDLYPDAHDLGPGDHPFGREAHVRVFTTMFIEPPVYLAAMLRDFYLAGGRVEIREFGDLREIAALAQPLVVNCTGLGARALIGDQELMPIKGQLSVLLPQPEVDYIALFGDFYMFPRRDGILMGGTHERDVWSMDPNPAAADRVFDAHKTFFDAMAGRARG